MTLLRRPTMQDGPEMWRLARDSGGLELNTGYMYALMAWRFADTCAVAEADGRLVGFVAGFRPPDDPEALFVWQVGVDPGSRGQGLAGRMLDHLVARQDPPVRYLEATVTPGNGPSCALFRSFARRAGAACAESEALRPEHLPEPGHEPEHLFRIGPIPKEVVANARL